MSRKPQVPVRDRELDALFDRLDHQVTDLRGRAAKAVEEAAMDHRTPIPESAAGHVTLDDIKAAPAAEKAVNGTA